MGRVDNRRIDDDGIHPRAGVLRDLIESDDVPVLQVQHLAKRGSFAAACGSFGQTTESRYYITCEKCKALAEKRDARRRRQ